jgi:hypothetical protein
VSKIRVEHVLLLLVGGVLMGLSAYTFLVWTDFSVHSIREYLSNQEAAWLLLRNVALPFLAGVAFLGCALVALWKRLSAKATLWVLGVCGLISLGLCLATGLGIFAAVVISLALLVAGIRLRKARVQPS